MILSDREIRELILNGTKLIEDFDESSLQSESYDLSIGSKVSKYSSDFRILDLDNQKSIDSAYVSTPIPPAGYILGPKEYILVSIAERINLPPHITAHIRPRTKFTRIGLIVSDQHCNSSYSGNLNLGLFNVNPFAIKIHSGMKIAQIVFEELKSTPTLEKQYKGSYQNEAGTKGALFLSENASTLLLDSDQNKRLNLDKYALTAFNMLLDGLEK